MVPASLIARALFLSRPPTWESRRGLPDMSEEEVARNEQWGLDVNEIEHALKEKVPGFSPASFRRACGYSRT